MLKISSMCHKLLPQSHPASLRKTHRQHRHHRLLFRCPFLSGFVRFQFFHSVCLGVLRPTEHTFHVVRVSDAYSSVDFLSLCLMLALAADSIYDRSGCFTVVEGFSVDF